MKQVSPGIKARITGFVYLMIFLAAPSGAASATPIKMAINLSCDLAVAFLLYALLKPVSRSLSLLAALFRLIFISSRDLRMLSMPVMASLRGIVVPAVVGEGSLTLWLLVMGVRDERWQQQADFQQAVVSSHM